MTTNEPQPTKPTKRRQSAALTEVRKRAISVTAEEIDAYEPTALDMKIAEAVLGGCLYYNEIADQTGESSSAVSAAMRDPTTCAWICREISKLIQTRIGLIDASMMNKAVGGDVRAADLLYKRFDAYEQVSRHENVGHGLEKMTIGELKALVKEAARVVQAKDVEFTLTDGSDSGGKQPRPDSSAVQEQPAPDASGDGQSPASDPGSGAAGS